MYQKLGIMSSKAQQQMNKSKGKGLLVKANL